MSDLATKLEHLADAGVAGISLQPLHGAPARRRVRSRRLVAAVAGVCLLVGSVAVAASLRPQPSNRTGGSDRGSELVADAVYKVASAAMAPTLAVGDDVSVASNFGTLERGDVVRVRIPASILTGFKRVIGLPGETVAGRDDAVWVNGHRLTESYVAGVTTTFAPVRLSRNTYFLLGDNRENSKDSRVWGAVPHTAILGVALRITSPTDRVGPIAGSPRVGGTGGDGAGLPVHRADQAPPG